MELKFQEIFVKELISKNHQSPHQFYIEALSAQDIPAQTYH